MLKSKVDLVQTCFDTFTMCYNPIFSDFSTPNSLKIMHNHGEKG